MYDMPVDVTARGRRVTPEHINKPEIGKAVGDFSQGVTTQAVDYQGIVNHDYESQSVLNRATEYAFAGDFESAGRVISENPARFAGNVAMEAGLLVTPVGAVAKAAQASRIVPRVLRNERLVQVVGSKGTNFFSRHPQPFYMEKHLVNTGQVKIKSVDVSRGQFEQYNVQSLRPRPQPKDPPGTLSGSFGRKWKRDPTAKIGDEGVIVTPKGETYSPLVKRTNQPIIKTRQEFEEKLQKIKKIKDPAKRDIETQKLTRRRSLDQFDTPEDIKNRSRKIDYSSRDEKVSTLTEVAERPDEWILPTELQQKAKVIGELGKKRNVVDRIVRPYLSSDTLVNALYASGVKARRTEQYIMPTRSYKNVATQGQAQAPRIRSRHQMFDAKEGMIQKKWTVYDSDEFFSASSDSMDWKKLKPGPVVNMPGFGNTPDKITVLSPPWSPSAKVPHWSEVSKDLGKIIHLRTVRKTRRPFGWERSEKQISDTYQSMGQELSRVHRNTKATYMGGFGAYTVGKAGTIDSMKNTSKPRNRR